MNWVSKDLREMARGRDCLINSPLCRYESDTVVLCHGRKGKGMALKACDSDSVFGCYWCNYYTDQSGAPRDEIEAVWREAKDRMMGAMMDIFSHGSDKHKKVTKKWIELNE